MKKKIVFLLLVICFSISIVRTVSAQEASDAADTASPAIEVPVDTQVFTRDRETDKITQLRTLYRDQVQVYRTSEQQFVIARANYQQVDTLAALEVAVNATRTVMFDRSRVMITYLELLNAVLNETNGIELSLKDESQTELTGIITALKIHQESIQLSQDRQGMALLADEFIPIATSYQSSVYKSLSLIRIGKMQEVRDKSEIIYSDIISMHESEDVSAIVTARRSRAYAEIERNFDGINEQLIALNGEFSEGRRNGFERSFYEGILQDLGPVYAQLSQTLEYLEEVLELE